jgi:hypothetical protein
MFYHFFNAGKCRSSEVPVLGLMNICIQHLHQQSANVANFWLNWHMRYLIIFISVRFSLGKIGLVFCGKCFTVSIFMPNSVQCEEVDCFFVVNMYSLRFSCIILYSALFRFLAH